MKKTKTFYWLSTGLVVLFDSIMPAFTFNTPLAIEGIHHLGFPDYFRIQLTIFKVIGGLLLIIPGLPRRVKEWAYAGFAFNFLSAAVAHMVVDGLGFQSFMPLIIFSVLVASYMMYNRIHPSTELRGSLSFI